ncbi:nucleotidyltransferase [Lysinibacillus fusiformis]|nr:nucleotidyltransferase [Lysinibacillus fusiformis]MCK1987177.1 nucleotidyltransferase [Lysinibacillus fusiformis]
MTISNSQLDVWSNQGATTTPKLLREKIERVLRSETSLVSDKKDVSIYLQGSYKNSTNIYGNSDVDIVVQTNKVFYGDISQLTEIQKNAYKNYTKNSDYTWDIYKKEIVSTLVEYFGSDKIIIGNKSIKVETDNFEADVVPCIQYRKYYDYGNTTDSQNYVEGIKFFTTEEKREVINYPKLHFSFGAEKNRETREMYKPTIRIFKNIKKTLVNAGKLDKSTVPSYFIENLLYNVPNERFVKGNYSLTVLNLLSWLAENRENMSLFICQNKMVNLFGPTPEQWNEVDATNFIYESIILSNEWGK